MFGMFKEIVFKIPSKGKQRDHIKYQVQPIAVNKARGNKTVVLIFALYPIWIHEPLTVNRFIIPGIKTGYYIQQNQN